MSNKIKSIFRFKGTALKISNREYSFFLPKKKNSGIWWEFKELLLSLVLPYKVLLKRALYKNCFQIWVDNKKGKLKKKLKKKLGFFSGFLKSGLSLKKKLIMRSIFFVGTGFKVFKSKQKRGEDLILKIGLSHFFKITVPTGVLFKVIKINELKFYSLDKELLGSFLNFASSMRFPDSYKGRGLLISNQPKVKFKTGKIKS
jgi:hypothetical protein